MADIDLDNKTDREILILLVDHVNSLSRLLQTQNERLSSLESWRDRMLGAIGLLALVIPFATAAILKLIK